MFCVRFNVLFKKNWQILYSSSKQLLDDNFTANSSIYEGLKVWDWQPNIWLANVVSIRFL